MGMPRLLLDLVNAPAIRAVPIWISDRRFRRWKHEHPGASFADFYVADAERKLRKRRPHSTLGVRGWAGRGSNEIDWDHESFAARGLVNWRQIVALGLEPHMRCVDYGCGSLRLGQHAIRFLETANYFGIDLTDSFIHAGLPLLPADLVATKKPKFGVIDEPLLDEVRDWGPDFIFANAVLQHVPPGEVALFFDRLGHMMGPSTRAYVLFVASHKIQRLKAMSWSYPAAFIEGYAASAVPQSKVRTIDAGDDYQRIAGGNRKILCIEPSGLAG
jgi:hypothetical protein